LTFVGELTDMDLFPRMHKQNPHKQDWHHMLLFLRCQVEDYAFKRWTSEQGLDEEHERRKRVKTDKAELTFQSKLADLRKRASGSGKKNKTVLVKKQKEHVHTFEQVENGVQKCSACGFTVEMEEL
jgi:DNA-repair protein complementing XP-A cells